MRYPFYPYKVDSDFLEDVSYGPHEGVDINGLGGGNTDCGYELFPITNCQIVHISESTQDYGNLIVYEIAGEFGRYWVRYAHCQKILVKEGDWVDRSTPIALMGSTGNSTHCHLHFDVFSKVPPNWRWYSKDKELLRNYLVHPLEFISANKELEGRKGDVSDPLKACMKDREQFWKERDTALTQVKILEKKLEELASKPNNCQDQLKRINADISSYFRDIESIMNLAANKINNFEEANEMLSDLKKELDDLHEEVEKKEDKSPLWESIKEPLRWTVIGAFSYVVTYMLGQLGDVPQNEITFIMTLALRGLDKYLHELSKKKDEMSVKGLLPF